MGLGGHGIQMEGFSAVFNDIYLKKIGVIFFCSALYNGNIISQVLFVRSEDDRIWD